MAVLQTLPSLKPGAMDMKVAIVGGGIAGLVSAWTLHGQADFTLFEANDYPGGHTHTVDVEQDGTRYAVDTGFIVFNPNTYPNFIRLLEQLGIGWRDTEMSFSVSSERTGLEYAGTNLNTVFAQRANLLRGSFLWMLREILRFNREARGWLEASRPDITLGDFLRSGGYSAAFSEHYLIPMAAAIWSADPARIGDFPATTFFRFFRNHGLLSATGQPLWRTVAGGSRAYVEKLTAAFPERIRLRSPVASITRRPDHVEVQVQGAPAERFDQVVIAAHSDQALRMLADPSDREREILGAIAYQPNEVVLHTDSRLLPRSRRAWAAWNYRIPQDTRRAATVTYDMNRLQGLVSREPFCVTLNDTASIDPGRVLRRFRYDHPVFDQAAMEAQQRHGEISGQRRTHYCGAYWGYGFHEDGVVSALRIAETFGLNVERAA